MTGKNGYISEEIFSKLELRVGTVVSAEIFHKARKPAYILEINFGDGIGIMKSSAQITGHYTPEMLVGMQIIGVTNMPPKQIGNMMSECLVTGFYDANGDVILAVPDKPAINGSKLS